jgi:sarcosine oxidase subunit beta
MSAESLGLWTRLRSEVGDDMGWRRSGYLVPALTAEHAEALATAVSLQRRAGIEIEELTGQEVRRRWPIIKTHDFVAASFTPNDGQADPYVTVGVLSRAARGLGAKMEMPVEVIAVDVSRGHPVIHTTTGRTIEPDWLIVATGIWSNDLALPLGLDLHLEPRRHQLHVTNATPWIPEDFPCLIEAGAAHLFVRREGPGLLAGYDDPLEATDNLFAVDSSILPKLAEALMNRLDNADAIRIARSWAAGVDLTHDHQGMLGVFPAGSNVIWAAGFSGHGFMHAPSVARMITEAVMTRAEHSFPPELRLQRPMVSPPETAI